MKNYNIFALRGDNSVSDVEVCSTLGLPMELAGTPELNTAALNKMHKENYNGYIEQGLSEADAMRMANQRRDAAAKEIRDLTK